MSLLDRSPEQVIVYPSRDVTDPETGGRRREAGNPASVGLTMSLAFVRPKADVVTEGGYDTEEGWVVMARHLPFGAKTVIKRDGRLWDVTAEPMQRKMSRRTAHAVAPVSARTGVPR